jgi:hypothetical protein
MLDFVAVRRLLLIGGLCLATALPRLAAAKAQPAPLQLLAPEKLRELAPLLNGADLSLIETTDKGHIKQITTMSFVGAPPQVVHDIVGHPERYGDFVHGMQESTIKPGPDGTIDHQYRLSYKFYNVEGRHRYTLLPPAPGFAAPPIDMYDPDDNGVRHYRWEFLPAGDGTLLVLYGYTQIPLDGLLDSLMKRAPTLELGLGLMTQMTLILSMKERAQKVYGKKLAPPRGTPNFTFLLERGTVALFRAVGGDLAEVDMIELVRAPADVTMKVLSAPQQWKEFIPSLDNSIHLDPNRDGVPGVELEQSIPMMSWSTKFRYRLGGNALDMLGEEGDLRNARLRWDAAGWSGGRTQLVLRASEQFEHGSMVLQTIYRIEPLFKYGVNVGLGLVLLKGVTARSEHLAPQHATR